LSGSGLRSRCSRGAGEPGAGAAAIAADLFQRRCFQPTPSARKWSLGRPEGGGRAARRAGREEAKVLPVLGRCRAGYPCFVYCWGKADVRPRESAGKAQRFAAVRECIEGRKARAVHRRGVAGSISPMGATPITLQSPGAGWGPSASLHTLFGKVQTDRDKKRAEFPPRGVLEKGG
jgi:hypothetical protein